MVYGNSQGQGPSKPCQDVDMQTFMNNTMLAQMSKIQSEVENLKTQQQGGGNQNSNQASSSSGRLPASTENPRHQINVVTTRSGIALKDLSFPSKDLVPEKAIVKVEDVLDESKEEPLTQRNSSKGKAPMGEESAPCRMNGSKDKEIDDSVIPCNLLPFPQRLWKSKESEREIEQVPQDA